MSEVKSTINWRSSCGADFSFVEKYLREKDALESVRRITRAEMSKGVLDAYNYIQDVDSLSKEYMLENQNRDVVEHNNRVYESYNINLNDGVPAYVDKELKQPVTELGIIDSQLLEQQRQNYLSELYDAIRIEGLSSYLSDDVMNVLDSDNFSFKAYDEAKMLEEAYEADKQSVKSKSMLAPDRDYSKGFDVDELGNVHDDGYGFDEEYN